MLLFALAGGKLWDLNAQSAPQPLALTADIRATSALSADSASASYALSISDCSQLVSVRVEDSPPRRVAASDLARSPELGAGCSLRFDSSGARRLLPEATLAFSDGSSRLVKSANASLRSDNDALLKIREALPQAKTWLNAISSGLDTYAQALQMKHGAASDLSEGFLGVGIPGTGIFGGSSRLARIEGAAERFLGIGTPKAIARFEASAGKAALEAGALSEVATAPLLTAENLAGRVTNTISELRAATGSSRIAEEMGQALRQAAGASADDFVQRARDIMARRAIPEAAQPILAQEVGSAAGGGTVPRGFSDAAQFKQAGEELAAALAKAGLAYSRIGVRGSSVTGVSSKGGPFRMSASGGKLASDVDAFVELAVDPGLRSSKKNPGFIHPDKMMKQYSALQQWAKKWSLELGRDITPGGFKPGTFTDPNHVTF